MEITETGLLVLHLMFCCLSLSSTFAYLIHKIWFHVSRQLRILSKLCNCVLLNAMSQQQIFLCPELHESCATTRADYAGSDAKHETQRIVAMFVKQIKFTKLFNLFLLFLLTQFQLQSLNWSVMNAKLHDIRQLNLHSDDSLDKSARCPSPKSQHLGARLVLKWI